MAPTVGQFESTASTSAADQPQAEGLPDGKFTVGTSSTSLFGNEKSATVHGKLFTVGAGAVSVSGQTTSVPGVVVNKVRRVRQWLKSHSDSGSLNTLSGDPDVGTGRAKFAPVIDKDTEVKHGSLNTLSGDPDVGTGRAKFDSVIDTDTAVKYGMSQIVNVRIHCIICMPEYRQMSLEELRLEDYTANRKTCRPVYRQTLQGVSAPFQSLGEANTNSSFTGGPFSCSSKPLFGGTNMSGLFTVNPSSSFSSQNCTPPKPADEPVTLGWLSTTVPSKFVFGTSSCTNPFYFGNETLKDTGTSQQDSCTKAAEVNGQTQDFGIQTSDCGTQTSDFDMLASSFGTQMLSVGVQTSSANVQTLTSSTQTSDFGTQADFNLLETSSLQLQVTELQRKVELSSRTFLNEIEILKTMLKLKTLFHEKEHYDYCNMLSYRGLQTTLNSSSCALGCCQHEVAKCVLDRVARGHLAVTGSEITEHTSCDTRNIDEEVVHCNISECSQNKSYESESIQQHKEDVWEKAETVVDGDEDRTAQKLKHGCDTSDQIVISMEKNSTPSDVPKNEQVALLKKEVNSLKDELLALKNQLDILKEESEPKVNQECSEEVVHCNISECSQNQSYESESIQQHKEDVWEKAETVVDGDEDRTAQKLKHGCDTSDQIVISMEKNSTPSDVPKNEQVALLKKEVNSLKDELLALKNQLDILKEESEPKVNQECVGGQHAVQHPVLLSQVNTADVLDKGSEFRTPGVQRIDC